MSVLPPDGKWQWPPGPVFARPPDTLERDIRELAACKEADARAKWQKAREAQFAEMIYDDLLVLDDTVALLADRSRSAATTRTYKLHWDRFTKWVGEFTMDDGYPLSPLPACPELCAFYLLSELTAGASASAIRKMAAAISDAHVTNQERDPTQTLVCRAAVRLARQYDGKFSKVAPSNGKSNGKANGELSDHKEREHEEP